MCPSPVVSRLVVTVLVCMSALPQFCVRVHVSDSSVLKTEQECVCVCAWWGHALLDDLCLRSGPVWSVFTLDPGEVEHDCPGFSTLSRAFPDSFLTSPFLFFLVGSFPLRAQRQQENNPHLVKRFGTINGK